MKPYKFLFTILFAIIPFIVGATGQITEKIYINGVRCDLLSLPIECDDLLSVKVGELVPDGYVNTGLYRGYIGEWELKENKLYLRKIILGYTEKSVPTDVLNRVFAPYCTNEGILASWLTGFLRVGKGEMLVYDDFWEACTYEHEMFLTIKDGCVTGEKVYDNYIKEGVSVEVINEALNKEIPSFLFADNDEYILIDVSDISLDENANMTDCKVVMEMDGKTISDQNNTGIHLVKNILKKQTPWTYICCNGKIETYCYTFRAYNSKIFKNKIRRFVDNIYAEVKAMLDSGNVNSAELVDKYCTARFRKIYHEAYDWAKENNEKIFDFCHWIRLQDYENPEYHVWYVDDSRLNESLRRKVVVRMFLRDTIGGNGVKQTFFLKLQEKYAFSNMWYIDDFMTLGVAQDGVILKRNLEEAKKRAE